MYLLSSVVLVPPVRKRVPGQIEYRIEGSGAGFRGERAVGFSIFGG